MQKWTISITGQGPKQPSVEQANELVGQMLEEGLNIRQAVLIGESPVESANLLDERDQKIAAGKDITIKPRKKHKADPKLVKDLENKLADAEAQLTGAQEEVLTAAGLLEKLSASNEQLEREKNDVLETVKLQQSVIADLEAKIEAATKASPLAASVIADVAPVTP